MLSGGWGGGDHNDAGYHGGEKAKVIRGSEGVGKPPVDPSAGDAPLQSANGFCE